MLPSPAVTDLPQQLTSVPSRLGVSGRIEDGELLMELTPTAETVHHGIVRASVLSFLIDALSGITLDQSPDVWTLTTDLSMRMLPEPAPAEAIARNTILRRGSRSGSCSVEVTTSSGEPLATGAIGFATVPRREGDPPKPNVTPAQAAQLFRGMGRLDQPLREEAGIQVVEAAAGIVEVEATPALRNPAGTLQGAMVALVIECAVEELAGVRAHGPVIVTDLDIRYLAKTGAGPVRSCCRPLGDGPDAPVEVTLTDCSDGRLTTHAYARAVVLP